MTNSYLYNIADVKLLWTAIKHTMLLISFNANHCILACPYYDSKTGSDTYQRYQYLTQTKSYVLLLSNTNKIDAAWPGEEKCNPH